MIRSHTTRLLLAASLATVTASASVAVAQDSVDPDLQGLIAEAQELDTGMGQELYF